MFLPGRRVRKNEWPEAELSLLPSPFQEKDRIFSKREYSVRTRKQRMHRSVRSCPIAYGALSLSKQEEGGDIFSIDSFTVLLAMEDGDFFLVPAPTGQPLNSFQGRHISRQSGIS